MDDHPQTESDLRLISSLENYASARVRNSLEPPHDEGCDGDGCHEGLDVAVEASCDAPPVLEAAEHALDDVALAVDLAVVLDVHFAVGL